MKVRTEKVEGSIEGVEEKCAKDEGRGKKKGRRVWREEGECAKCSLTRSRAMPARKSAHLVRKTTLRVARRKT